MLQSLKDSSNVQYIGIFFLKNWEHIHLKLSYTGIFFTVFDNSLFLSCLRSWSFIATIADTKGSKKNVFILMF